MKYLDLEVPYNVAEQQQPRAMYQQTGPVQLKHQSIEVPNQIQKKINSVPVVTDENVSEQVQKLLIEKEQAKDTDKARLFLLGLGLAMKFTGYI